MANASFGLVLGSIMAVVLVVVGAGFAQQTPPDARQQIAEHNTAFGQLRGGLLAHGIRDGDTADDDAAVYDSVSGESDETNAADVAPLDGTAGFPPALEFNSEKNRIHKRLPVPDEDYHLLQNKMIHIADGA